MSWCFVAGQPSTENYSSTHLMRNRFQQWLLQQWLILYNWRFFTELLLFSFTITVLYLRWNSSPDKAICWLSWLRLITLSSPLPFQGALCGIIHRNCHNRPNPRLRHSFGHFFGVEHNVDCYRARLLDLQFPADEERERGASPNWTKLFLLSC